MFTPEQEQQIRDIAARALALLSQQRVKPGDKMQMKEMLTALTEIVMEGEWRMKPVPLTYAQAETLCDLMDRSYISERIPFVPAQAFPGRDNSDNGKRRCCRAMTTKGLFWECSTMPGYLVPNVQACRDAWAAWRDKNPDAELWG